MVIRKQAVISWLLDDNCSKDVISKIVLPNINNIPHLEWLKVAGLDSLKHVRDLKPNWGLPEILMPSFEKAMRKSAKSFVNIDHLLFQEFYKDNVCGILLNKIYGTIIYYFANDCVHVWIFRDDEKGYSIINNYFIAESSSKNTRNIKRSPFITNSEIYVEPEKKDILSFFEGVLNLLISFLALKKYAEVETIIVPANSKKIVENDANGYRQKEKVRNDSGQQVIVMDSHWFVKIVNDNDIPVRGFFKMQPYKNENGEWEKKLIYVKPFVRHGYHRNAKIEVEKSKSQSTGIDD